MLTNHDNQISEGLHSNLFEFFIVFKHEKFAMVIYKLYGLIYWKGYAIIFEFFENLLDFIPIKSAFNISLSIEIQYELIDTFKPCDN